MKIIEKPYAFCSISSQCHLRKQASDALIPCLSKSLVRFGPKSRVCPSPLPNLGQVPCLSEVFVRFWPSHCRPSCLRMPPELEIQRKPMVFQWFQELPGTPKQGLRAAWKAPGSSLGGALGVPGGPWGVPERIVGIPGGRWGVLRWSHGGPWPLLGGLGAALGPYLCVPGSF